MDLDTSLSLTLELWGSFGPCVFKERDFGFPEDPTGTEEHLWEIFRAKEVYRFAEVCYLSGAPVIRPTWRVRYSYQSGAKDWVSDAQIFNIFASFVRHGEARRFGRRSLCFLREHIRGLIVFRHFLQAGFPRPALLSLYLFLFVPLKRVAENFLSQEDTRHWHRVLWWESRHFHHFCGVAYLCLLIGQMAETTSSVFSALAKIALEDGISLSREFLYSGGNPEAVRRYIKDNISDPGQPGDVALSIVVLAVFVHMYGTKLLAGASGKLSRYGVGVRQLHSLASTAMANAVAANLQGGRKGAA